MSHPSLENVTCKHVPSTTMKVLGTTSAEIKLASGTSPKVTFENERCNRSKGDVYSSTYFNFTDCICSCLATSVNNHTLYMWWRLILKAVLSRVYSVYAPKIYQRYSEYRTNACNGVAMGEADSLNFLVKRVFFGLVRGMGTCFPYPS